MPTISGGISVALQAVLTQSQVMEITQHNVANASTPGYRRQSAILTSTAPASFNGAEYGMSAGQKGGGVSVDRIQRFNLEFFDGRYRSVSAETSNWESQSSILSQLEPTLAETTADGLLPKLDQFFSSWQALSDDPTNVSQRAIVLDDASSLANAFTRRTSQISQMRGDQNLSVISQVDQINSLADQVAQLNGQISHVLSVGQQPNDLMDKRDLALDQLSQLTGSVSFNQKNGEVMVSIGGNVLVVGHETIKLHTQDNDTDSSVVDVYIGDNVKLSPPSGTLKGTLEVRDRILVDQQNGLNTLAAGLITQVNALHKPGFGLNNATNLDFFSGTDALTIAVNPLLNANSIATSSGTGLPGNNDVALAISALKTTKGMSTGTATLNEFYGIQISDLALKTKRAADNSYQYGLVEKALSDQRESVAGVSLDEEAATMAKTQKAYQAAARVLTAYDEMLDTVINRMGLVGR